MTATWVDDDILEGSTFEDHKRWPEAREVYLSCDRCGAGGSVLADQQSVKWSVLPLKVHGGKFEHDCAPPPIDRRPAHPPSDELRRLADDMVVLRYFTNDGRLAVWNPPLRVIDQDGNVVPVSNLRSNVDGELKRDRQSVQRYTAGAKPGGLPSADPGSLTRAVGAFLRAADDDPRDDQGRRLRWEPPASELRAQIAELADEFRSATPRQQRPPDPVTAEQLAILRRRPLQPLTNSAEQFHRDEGQNRRQHAGRPVQEVLYPGRESGRESDTGRESEDEKPKADPLYSAQHANREPHLAEIRRIVDLLTAGGVALRLKLDGWTVPEIAEHVGEPVWRTYALIREAIEDAKAIVEQEQRLLDAA